MSLLYPQHCQSQPEHGGKAHPAIGITPGNLPVVPQHPGSEDTSAAAPAPSEKDLLFGPEKTREHVMEEIRSQPEVFREFQKLSRQLQDELVEFAMGVRGLKVTYDPVFKKIFNPEIRPERLEEFLSLCMKKKVKILRVLPNESQRLTEGGSLLVMDILVQLESGALVNVEIQRIGYAFPGARCACYSSDLLMRQYSQVREAKRSQGDAFSYKDIQGVFTIVLIQESTREFHQHPKIYFHHFRQTSRTGLKLDLLQEYILIPLDIFRKTLQNRNSKKRNSLKGRSSRLKNKLEAWLAFIASDRPEDILEVVRAFPEFRELYREVFAFRYQHRELISMYSEALRILDANTVQYMVEEQKKEILELTEALEDTSKALEDKSKALEDTSRALEDKSKALQDTSRALEEERKARLEKDKEIMHLRALLKATKEL